MDQYAHHPHYAFDRGQAVVRPVLRGIGTGAAPQRFRLLRVVLRDLNKTLELTVTVTLTCSVRSSAIQSPSAMKNETSYFYLLDAIRAAAALIVLCRHTTYFFGWLLPVSHLAVDLFFVLSGVVVANAYEPRLRQGLPVARFMLIRLIRLYPLYLLGSAIGLLPVLAARYGLSAQALQGGFSGTLVAAVLMLPMMSGDELFPLDTPAWSLFFELAANLFYAVILRHLSGRLLLTLILGCAAGLALSLVATPAHTLHGGFSPSTMPVGAFRVGFSFFMGVALYRRFMRLRSVGRSIGTNAPRGAGTRALVLVAALAAALTVSPPTALRPIYELLAVTVLFPSLIALAMHCPLSGRGARWCALLGMLSYPIYVLHVPVARTLNGLLVKGLHLPLEHWLPYAGIAFLAMFLPACWIADRWYDGPARARLSSLLVPKFSRLPGQSG
jgi:peptidoglycan/LPS O-acetylase OafA/YrhL